MWSTKKISLAQHIGQTSLSTLGSLQASSASAPLALGDMFSCACFYFPGIGFLRYLLFPVFSSSFYFLKQDHPVSCWAQGMGLQGLDWQGFTIYAALLECMYEYLLDWPKRQIPLFCSRIRGTGMVLRSHELAQKPWLIQVVFQSVPHLQAK